MSGPPYKHKILYSRLVHGSFLVSLMALILLFPISITKGKESFVSTECELKTAFIYQFTKYVSWPKTKKNKDRLVIGVIAHKHMFDAIKKLDGKLSQGMKISVISMKDYSQLDGIDILYIESWFPINEELVKKAVKHHVLTISDRSDAAEKGIIIALYMVGSKLRFDVNLKVADASSLRLSSRLLRLANKLII